MDGNHRDPVVPGIKATAVGHGVRATPGSGGRLPAVSAPAIAASVTAAADAALIRAAVLEWFATHGRPLNFRARRDPYAVLVSEAMAQQTQISRVEPAWEAFLGRFPTVEVLAAAPVADVLRAWQGMGYNRRALNLQRAARTVVDQHRGRFPDTVAGLELLPGVGPYTARAIAAIAFGRAVGAVDTNVRRVLGRVAGGWAGMKPAMLQALADEMVPPGQAGEWTHALMDIGARFCRPRTPVCGECPVRGWCTAAKDSASTPAAGGSAPTAAAWSTAEVASATPFRSTSRWLRGRLVDRARIASGDGWVRVDQAIELHEAAVVLAAAHRLAGEGLLEIHPGDPALARLPR